MGSAEDEADRDRIGRVRREGEAFVSFAQNQALRKLPPRSNLARLRYWKRGKEWKRKHVSGILQPQYEGVQNVRKMVVFRCFLAVHDATFSPGCQRLKVFH